MKIELKQSTSKYAQAYINLYRTELTDNLCSRLLMMSDFFNKNKSFYAYLSMPQLDIKIKQQFVEKVVETFGLTKNQHSLISLLLADKKINLLGDVVQKIVNLFNTLNGICACDVYTSHDINENQKQKILNFIKVKLKSSANATFHINKQLILGIKIKTESFVWEKSVSKYLSQIKNKKYLQV